MAVGEWSPMGITTENNGWFVATTQKEWRVAPSVRITELPSNIDVVGFGEREMFVRRLVESVGLPLNNVSRISFKQESAHNSLAVGSVHMETGELTFYKRMEGLPEIAQLGVAVHELAHENDPHDGKNSELYGSVEQMERTAQNVSLVAEQTQETHLYLNGYHRMLCKALEAGDIDKERFLQETHAIIIELRFTNPRHLENVLRLQNSETADQILQEVDTTLLTLMPHLENPVQLNEHITSLRRSLKKTV